MVAHSLCEFGGGEEERLELEAYREIHFPAPTLLKTTKLPSPAELRTEGLCPLAPEEADLMLAALGFNRKTRIFVAGAQIYGGVDKIVCSEHLLVALDFIGCTAADAFARQTLGVSCRHWCLVIEYTTEQGRCRPSAKQAETFSHLHEEFHHRVENI
ncbi:hypothetical protein LWI29_002001 [Acer saccharum]|uniref:O-fucosyltransferase family protein n=1 Tax=Acer saccharum TaxID=4024 RepID=A0AA39VF34_ACESA|nr:hypothetical protein LWI29_002001 [Acer saccharum]